MYAQMCSIEKLGIGTGNEARVECIIILPSFHINMAWYGTNLEHDIDL